MASTYTTSLKIQQIGSGEQSGVWGSTTNTNWNLIEQAVAGVQTITMSNADRTLTNLDGVSDEARNMVLVVQGNNSAIRKVVAPQNQPKMYIVSNQTTGSPSGYAINFGAPSGSYVTIPNGVTAQVYTDGTNFYSAQTGSAGDFNINGNLTVTGSSTDIGNLSAAGALYAFTAATSTASSISGTTLTIGGTITGTFAVGQIISGTGVTSGTTITALGTGTGGAGTYTVSVSQTVSSVAINGAVGVSLTNPYIPNNLAIGGAANIGGAATIGGNTAITGTLSTTGDATFSGTGQIKLPAGTTAQRSALPSYGMFRFNSTTNQFEGYNSAVGTTISTITFSTTTATLTTASAHGLSSGAVVVVTGATPSAYNGTFAITVTGTTTFTYTMASNPGANASPVGSYTTGYWGQVGGGAQAQGVIYENGQTISSNYTMTAGSNGTSAGPITIATGVTVTIPTGSRWVVL
jgi:hypothetical protein